MQEYGIPQTYSCSNMKAYLAVLFTMSYLHTILELFPKHRCQDVSFSALAKNAPFPSSSYPGLTHSISSPNRSPCVEQLMTSWMCHITWHLDVFAHIDPFSWNFSGFPFLQRKLIPWDSTSTLPLMVNLYPLPLQLIHYREARQIPTLVPIILYYLYFLTCVLPPESYELLKCIEPSSVW